LPVIAREESCSILANLINGFARISKIGRKNGDEQGTNSFESIGHIDQAAKQGGIAMSDKDAIFMELPIKQVVLVTRLRVRMRIDDDTCKAYAALMAEGASFSPLKVVRLPDNTYVLADGWHRLEAYRLNGQTEVSCEIIEGDFSKAILIACTANATHPRHLRNEDKRQAVEMLLMDPEYNDPDVWSDRAIARNLGVSHVFVGNIRERMYPAIGEERSRAREQKRLERETEIARRSQERNSILDHDDVPAGFPPFVLVKRKSRNGFPGDQRRGRGGKNTKKGK
jgi:ParB-like nuclease domain